MIPNIGPPKAIRLASFICLTAFFWNADCRPVSARPPEPTSVPTASRELENQSNRSIDDQLLLEPPFDGPKRPNEREGEPQGSTTSKLSGDDRRAEPSGSVNLVHAIDVIGTQMHEAARNLTRRDPTLDTVSHQDTIIANLDDLIDALRREQKQQRTSQQTATQSNQESPNPMSPGDSTAMSKSGSPDQASAGGKKDDSQNRPSNLQATLAEHWGHLPERLRTQMQNITAPEFLPQYRELIEAYYRRLAEDRTSK